MHQTLLLFLCLSLPFVYSLSPCDYVAGKNDAMYTTQPGKWTIPTNVTSLCIIMWGAGGGGGSCDGGGDNGGGGGAGAFGLISAYPVTQGDLCVFLPGQGGAGGVPYGSQPGNGNETTFSCGDKMLVVGGGQAGQNFERNQDGAPGAGGAMPAGFELAYQGNAGNGNGGGATYVAPFTLKDNFKTGSGGNGATNPNLYVNGAPGQTGGIYISWYS